MSDKRKIAKFIAKLEYLRGSLEVTQEYMEDSGVAKEIVDDVVNAQEFITSSIKGLGDALVPKPPKPKKKVTKPKKKDKPVAATAKIGKKDG